MPAIAWTVSVIFQYSEPKDIEFFGYLMADIRNAGNMDRVAYFLLLQDELNKKAYLFQSDAAVKDFRQLGAPLPVPDLYNDDRVAKELWQYFLHYAGRFTEARHILLTHGHGIGMGFSSSLITRPYRTNTATVNAEMEGILKVPLATHAHQKTAQLLSRYSAALKEPPDENKAQGARRLQQPVSLKLLPLSGLADAIAAAYSQKLELLILGNCFMQLAENGYLFRDRANYLAATQGFFYRTGLDFFGLFSGLGKAEGRIQASQRITALCDGIQVKLKDPRVAKQYSAASLEGITAAFSFSVNDLGQYAQLKTLLGKLGQLFLADRSRLFSRIARIRENVLICRDVFQQQQLGIIDLIQFCKALLTDRSLPGSFPKVFDCLHEIIQLAEHRESPLVCAKRFPWRAYDIAATGGIGIDPNGLSVFFPRRKKKHAELDQFLHYFMEEIYKAGNLYSEFLAGNSWRDFVIAYYHSE